MLTRTYFYYDYDKNSSYEIVKHIKKKRADPKQVRITAAEELNMFWVGDAFFYDEYDKAGDEEWEAERRTRSHIETRKVFKL